METKKNITTIIDAGGKIIGKSCGNHNLDTDGLRCAGYSIKSDIPAEPDEVCYYCGEKLS